MITRRQIRQFVAVVETGGFTAASQHLNVTQPTLSSAIAELERQVGAPLLRRERRGVHLTDAGRELLAHARAIENEFRQVERIGAAAPVNAAPPLRLGVLPSIAPALLTQTCIGYAEHHSGLQLFEGSDAKLRRDLASGHIDVALTLIQEQARTGPALEEPYTMMLAENHPLAGEGRLEPEVLASQTMIARRSCEILAETSRFFTQRGVRPRFFLRSANEDRCMAMVRAGLGITTAPLSYAGQGVRAVPVVGYDYRRRIGIMSRPDKTVPAAFVEAWAAALDRHGSGSGASPVA